MSGQLTFMDKCIVLNHKYVNSLNVNHMIKNIKLKDDYLVSLGFAEKPQGGDFDYESFPSKIAGKPVKTFFNL